MARRASYRRSGACFPDKIFKNGAFSAFWSIFFLQFCPKIRVKMLICYIKIIDIVLLHIIFRGIGGRHRECLFIVQFGASWSTFSENILLKKIYI